MEIMYSKLSGVTHHNPDGTSRQEIIAELCYKDQPLMLVRQPNQYSYDNIGVYIAFEIGYINPELAGQLAAILDEGGEIEARISDITGGSADKPILGVNVMFHIYD
jgi:hypothetical protein